MLYMEIESHNQNQSYHGILAGDTEEALARIAVVEKEDEEDWADEA